MSFHLHAVSPKSATTPQVERCEYELKAIIRETQSLDLDVEKPKEHVRGRSLHSHSLDGPVISNFIDRPSFSRLIAQPFLTAFSPLIAQLSRIAFSVDHPAISSFPPL